jgi:BASS family bile acid:Na+ symporter
MDLNALIPLLAQAALFLIIVSFGLRAQARNVLNAMRHSGLMLRAIAAVYIIVPLAAVITCTVLPFDRVIATGIVLMAVSPLAPVIPARFMQAGFDASTAVGYYVALILFAVMFVPATVALLSAIYPANASISVAAVGRLVAVSVLLPIAVGVGVATFWPGFALRAAPITFWVGFVAVALLVVAVLYKQGSAIVGLFGDGSVAAIALTVTVGIVAGHLLGRPDPVQSNVLAISAAIRHPGIAALIAHKNFSDPRVMLTVMLFLLTSFVVSIVYQQWFKRAYPPAQVAPASA